METGLVWQPDVYTESAEIARRLNASTIVDIGCGEARKLSTLHPEFELVGVDFGANAHKCRETYRFGTWLEHDLDSEAPLPIAPDQVRRAVIVCSDVIEHLVHPERLLARLTALLSSARAVVLSTPERELTWGPAHRGPPPNACHVREWNRSEFEALLRKAGFAWLEVGLTRSSDQDSMLRTIFALCCPSRRALLRAWRVPSRLPRVL